MDTAIFGIRFGSNAELAPSLEELRVFLELPKKPGGRELHGDDLVPYGELLLDLASFTTRHHQGASAHEYQEKAFYGVLGHSQFIHPDLKQAVAQYKYHLHALATLDFKKPSIFIRSAEAELGQLHPKKKSDEIKINRLRDMVEERKRTLEHLRAQRSALIEELTLIALYIRGNLHKIENRCRASIVILVECLVSRDAESRVIEDIKEQFKGRLRDALQLGPVSTQQLEAAKKDVAVLTKEIHALFRDDVYALTGLFEIIHDHVKEYSRRIDAQLAAIESNSHRGVADAEASLAELGHVLVALVSDHHFDLTTKALHSETAHENILQEKRNELLSLLLEVLSRERRTRTERRTGEDRRKYNDPKYAGPQRRTGSARRTGKSRRG